MSPVQLSGCVKRSQDQNLPSLCLGVWQGAGVGRCVLRVSAPSFFSVLLLFLLKCYIGDQIYVQCGLVVKIRDSRGSWLAQLG